MNVNDPNNTKLSSSNGTNVRKRTITSSSSSEQQPPAKAPRRLTDDQPPADDDTNAPNWRGDPQQTYSDWKIEVAHSSGAGDFSQVDTYHVHKFVLGCGRRRSDYFSRLFRNAARVKEGETNTSRIELDSVAATAFPQLLDYVYQYEKPLQVQGVETAVALHHLGEYFEMQHLRYDAKQYLQKHMKVDNVHKIHSSAVQFQNGSILDAVVEFLGIHLTEVDPKTCPLVQQAADPELWLSILQHVKENQNDAQTQFDQSHHASKIVAQFTSHHRKTMDLEAFGKLTSDTCLPYIHPNAALQLCRWEDKFLHHQDHQDKKTSCEDDNQTTATTPTTSTKSRDHKDNNNNKLTPLQERCATCLSELHLDQWASFLAQPNKQWKLQERKPAFLVDLLTKSLTVSYTRRQDLESQIKQLRTLLAKFQPLHDDGCVVRRADNVSEFVSVPEELQGERRDLGPKLQFGFADSSRGTGDIACFPAFYYDAFLTVEEEEEEEEDGQD